MSNASVSAHTAGFFTRIRAAGVPIGVVLALGIFLFEVNKHQALGSWWLVRYAGYWLATAIWWLSCFSAGQFVLLRYRGARLSRLEHALLATALGVVAFALSVFLLGVSHLLYRPVFYLLPAALLSLSVRRWWPVLRQFRTWPERARQTATSSSLSLLDVGLLSFGGVAIGLLYINILSPENAGYDARWYHLPLAEHYVHAAAIEPFAEGWIFGGYPQLASYLYTWAFLVPSRTLFDQVELCAHIEFCLFLWTLAGVSALARRLLGNGLNQGAAPRHLWLGLFLFPGIFVYDSGLIIGSDHIMAFWVAPIALLWLRVARGFRLDDCLLLGALAAAAILTKYLAVMFLIVPALAVTWGALRRTLRPRRSALRLLPLRNIAAAAAACLLVSVIHWGKNWAWYGDPFFPILYKALPVEPLTADFSRSFEQHFQSVIARPPATWQGLWSSIKVLYNFSFVPNDYPAFHGVRPLFGSLFTLSLLVLPFLKRTQRIWAVFVAVHVGIFTWYWMHHMDRFLQVLVPWMAAGVVAVGIKVWRAHRLARVPLCLLVLAQVGWASDAYFFPTHSMLATAAPLRSADFIASSFTGRRAFHLAPFSTWAPVGKALPSNAKVVVHNTHVSLGVRTQRINDFPGTQTGISYGELASERAVYDRLRALGATHVAVMPYAVGQAYSPASNLLFHGLMIRQSKRIPLANGIRLYELPAAPPPAPSAEVQVAYWGCPGRHEPGLYPISALDIPGFETPAGGFPKPLKASRKRTNVLAFREQAEYLIYDTACVRPGAVTLGRSYRLLVQHLTVQYWARR